MRVKARHTVETQQPIMQPGGVLTPQCSKLARPRPVALPLAPSTAAARPLPLAPGRSSGIAPAARPALRGSHVCHGAHAKMAAAAVAAQPSSTTLVVTAACAYCLAAFALMVLAGWSRPVRKLASSYWLLSPLCLVYAYLLVASWAPDTLSLMMPGSLKAGLATLKPQFFPQLQGIVTLFSRLPVAASALLHLLTINLFAGRHIFCDGLVNGVPTLHSLLLSLMAAPAGLGVHLITKALARRKGAITVPSRDGSITIEPYDR